MAESDRIVVLRRTGYEVVKRSTDAPFGVGLGRQFALENQVPASIAFSLPERQTAKLGKLAGSRRRWRSQWRLQSSVTAGRLRGETSAMPHEVDCRKMGAVSKL